MGVKSYPSSTEREIITVKGCKVKIIVGKVYLEKGKSVRPLYKLFERYIGDWINLKIMESKLNGWLEREGETVKLKVISAKENGEIKGQYKWRKRKHHEWKWEETSIKTSISFI